MSELVRLFGRNATLLGGVLLAALLLAAAVVRLPPVQRWTAARITARLPAGISAQRAAIMLLPPGVRLAQISLAEGSTLGSVACRLRLTALLAGRLEIRAITVKGADLTVERTADGTVQLSTVSSSGGATVPYASALPDLPPLGTLPALAIRNANLTFVDRAARHGTQTLRFRALRVTLGSLTADSAPLVLSARLDPAGQVDAQGTLRQIAGAPTQSGDRTITLTVKATGLDAQTVFGYVADAVPGGGSAKATGTLDASLTATGRLLGAFVGDATLSDAAGSVVWDQVQLTAPLTVSGQFSASRDAVTVSNGQLSVAQLGAARITASDLGAEFAYADRVLSVTTARASLYGGAWSQRGAVTLGDPPEFNATLHADDLDCTALLTAVTGAPPQYGCERFSADAVVRGRWTGARTVARSAEGTGSVDLRGGAIPASSVIGAIWQAVVPLVHATRDVNDLTPPTRVDHLTQSFALQGGLLQTGDLSLVTDDYTMTGTGTVGLDGSLDLRTEIAMTPEGIAKLLTMASLPIPGGSATLPPIPARVAGSINLPIIRPEMDPLPADALQALVTDARGAGEKLKDAAGSGLHKLQRGIDTLW